MMATHGSADQAATKYVDEFVAAAELSLSVKTLRAWRLRCRGPAFHRFGTAVRYSLQDLDEWARARRIPARECDTHAVEGGRQ